LIVFFIINISFVDNIAPCFYNGCMKKKGLILSSVLLGALVFVVATDAKSFFIADKTVNDSKTYDLEPSVACSDAEDIFAQDDTAVLAAHYESGETADCMFVGCGGVI